MVDAADFNWSARGEIRGVEPPKFGESYRRKAHADPEPSRGAPRKV